MSGHLAAYTVELSQFNIQFTPRTAMRSQALSDFVVECNFALELGEVHLELDKNPRCLFTDGSSLANTGGSCVILISPEKFKIQQAIKFCFNVTNKEAEYEGLIAGLRMDQHLKVQVIQIFSDSQLVVKQLLGEYKTINDKMIAYTKIAKNLLQSFSSWTLNYTDRSENQWADALSKLVTPESNSSPEPIYT
ncbi:uncharacterized protein LOC141700745 [Apium graveolens]|uniref:uncharacterized protein LOC141700745 n=1 Tax=Apium graveolens TaxID=4045 RepID=UPI003D7AF864